MSQDPNHPPSDDDTTRRVSRQDLPGQDAGGPHPGSGPQPGGAHDGSGAQPGSDPAGGSGAHPGYAYGQPPTSPPGYEPSAHPQPAPHQSGHHQPGYPQPGYPQPGYPQPGYGYGPPQQHGPHVPGVYGPRPGTDDTTMAMLAHLLGLLVSWVGPLIIYLMKKDEAPYVRDQSAEALNFQITMFIGYLVAGVLSIVVIGIFLFPVIWIISLIFHIQAALAANRGERYRYPIALRMVS